MNKEDLNLYEDGNPVDESEVATAVAKLSDAVLFQDDGGSLYFLKADPDAFELGTIARIDELAPAAEADGPLREEIGAAARGL
jgi:hypothetical protein